MTVPPSEPATASRAALAARLTELRARAGLSGNALAKRLGAVQSRVWKIEHRAILPGEDDIRAWVQACGASDEAGAALLEMLAEARTEQAFRAVFRRKDGAAAYQERVQAIEARSTRIGEFQVGVIPGLLQTAGYAREMLSVPTGPRAWGTTDAGVEDMIDGRMRRQDILHDHTKRIQFVLHEAALRVLVSTPQVLAGQLGKLLSVVHLPAVELGVITFGQRMPAYPIGGFRVYDEDLAIVESIAGEKHHLAAEEPGEVAAFVRAFEALREAAVTGDEAAVLISAAAAALPSS